MLSADFHTHTNYCDGKNTPREMVEAAYQKGLTDFGVSGHAFFPYGWDDGMTEEAFSRYKDELLALKEEYAGRMNVYIGVELDSLGPVMKAEYSIGSVHCIAKSGEYIMVDSGDKLLSEAVERLWNGDWYALTTDYYESVAQVLDKTGADFIGHFDLITKFNQDYCHFDETADAYLEPSLAAMKKLNAIGVPFEINTGAISRGYRREPYPSPLLLRELHNMGGRIIINSDSHQCDTICYEFEKAIALAKNCGFTHSCILTPRGGFEKIAL